VVDVAHLDDAVAQLQREVSVERLASTRGVHLKARQGVLTGPCPFHVAGDHMIAVDAKANTWSCGGCGVDGGGPVEWTMKAEGVSRRHATQLLGADHDIGTGKVVRKSTVKKLDDVFGHEMDDDALMSAVVLYYHRTLKDSPEALAYLASRGLDDREIIERLKLGFANRTLGYRIPDKNRRDGAELRGRLQRIGIFRDSGHETLSGSVVVPIFDSDGARVVGMYGRKITPNLRQGTPLHLYIPSPPQGVWNRDALTGSEVVLCASLIDALTFYRRGIRYVTAICGRDHLPGEHRAAITKSEVKKAYLAFRRNKAGDETAHNVGAELNALGIETFRVLFPGGMDANDYVLEGKNLEEALRNGEWMGKGTVTESAPDATEPLGPDAVTKSACASTPMAAATGPDEMVFTFEGVRWRARGIEKNTSYGELKVNLLVSRQDAGFHIDTLDLYSAKARALFIKQAALDIGATEDTVKKQLGGVLLELEARVDERLRARLQPIETVPSMSEAERDEAMAMLRGPGLIERIGDDFERCGLVGEETNRLVGYIAATSRLLEGPLAVVVQSSSASGKTSLMEAVLDMMPPEERVSFSAMTGQSLFYMGGRDLAHKVLSVAEGEGAEQASYPLKLLQSEGRLTIASTGKDPATGMLVTHEYVVTGPVATFLTTTAIDLDEELVSRCLVLTVDEGAAQTKAIHAVQRSRETLSGILTRKDRDRIVRLHQNAQRLLKPVIIVNPYAERMGFADSRVRARRDQRKLLALVRAIALLHQHQREPKLVEHEGERVEYIEAEEGDVALATRLLADVLPKPDDDLPPVTRNVLRGIEALVAEKAKIGAVAVTEVRFTMREVRDHAGLGLTQAKTHLARLVEMEYVASRRTGRTFAYDMIRSGPDRFGRGSVGPRSAPHPDRIGLRDDRGKEQPERVGRGDAESTNGAADAPRRRT
jgi:DNA primase